MRKIVSLLIQALLLTTGLMSQSLIKEKKIELTKDQKKHEMEFALGNANTGGVTVFFEIEKGEKVKGEKRKYQRYEMNLDNDLNIVSGDYKVVGTKKSIKPRIYFKDFRIAYTTWVDDETDDKINKIMLQIVKFDNNNNIVSVQDYELCDEKGFDSYRVISYGNELLVMAQYEKKKTKDKNEKNRDYLVYKRIDAVSMQVKAESELNLLGKDELGLESFLVANNKIFLVGKQLLQTKVLGWKIPQAWLVFRLDLEGKEEARGQITIPGGNGIASVYMYTAGDMLYMAGEYGDPKAMGRGVAFPSGNKTVKVTNPYLGMFIKKFDFNLQEKATATFDYKEKILKKLKKGNPKFNPRKGAYNIQDFYVLPDGSFYLTSEMFVKYYETRVVKGQYTTTYYYYTHFDYMDAIVFKFTPNGELDWLIQIDRDNYRKTYSGHLRTQKPLEPGKLETFLVKDNMLACLYNTPGRKYGKKRFGLSEVLVHPDGKVDGPFDFTSDAQFGLLDGGIIQTDGNEVIAVGTDKKEDYLWVKKIRLAD